MYRIRVQRIQDQICAKPFGTGSGKI